MTVNRPLSQSHHDFLVVGQSFLISKNFVLVPYFNPMHNLKSGRLCYWEQFRRYGFWTQTVPVNAVTTLYAAASAVQTGSDWFFSCWPAAGAGGHVVCCCNRPTMSSNNLTVMVMSMLSVVCCLPVGTTLGPLALRLFHLVGMLLRFSINIFWKIETAPDSKLSLIICCIMGSSNKRQHQFGWNRIYSCESWFWLCYMPLNLIS